MGGTRRDLLFEATTTITTTATASSTTNTPRTTNSRTMAMTTRPSPAHRQSARKTVASEVALLSASAPFESQGVDGAFTARLLWSGRIDSESLVTVTSPVG
jgi:hypothetical protein